MHPAFAHIFSMVLTNISMPQASHDLLSTGNVPVNSTQTAKK